MTQRTGQECRRKWVFCREEKVAVKIVYNTFVNI